MPTFDEIRAHLEAITQFPTQDIATVLTKNRKVRDILCAAIAEALYRRELEAKREE